MKNKRATDTNYTTWVILLIASAFIGIAVGFMYYKAPLKLRVTPASPRSIPPNNGIILVPKKSIAPTPK